MACQFDIADNFSALSEVTTSSFNSTTGSYNYNYTKLRVGGCLARACPHLFIVPPPEEAVLNNLHKYGAVLCLRRGSHVRRLQHAALQWCVTECLQITPHYLSLSGCINFLTRL